MGRLAALGWIAGAALTHTTADLPSLASMSGIAVVLITSALLMRRFAPNPAGRVPVVLVAIGLTAGSALAGVAYTTWCAQARLADRLAPALEDKVTRVSFRVTGLSADRDGARRFEAQALDSPVPGVPQRILVNWTPPTQWGGETHAKAVADAQGLPEILPGQVWRAALVLRRPHGTVNPASFDYEGYMFARNVRAIGKVRGEPVLLADRPLDRLRSVQAILKLEDSVGAKRLEDACTRAAYFGDVRYRQIKLILNAALDREPLPELQPAQPALSHAFARSGEEFFGRDS